VLVGSAEYGLVACFDLAGRQVWRDGLVANVGSLAVTGDRGLVVLACFSEGIQRYALDGQKLERMALDEPCRLLALSFDGRVLLGATTMQRLLLADASGKTLASHQPEGPVAALALGPLADYAAVALADGQLIGLDLNSKNAL
jgi:hypothetical protein